MIKATMFSNYLTKSLERTINYSEIHVNNRAFKCYENVIDSLLYFYYILKFYFLHAFFLF